MTERRISSLLITGGAGFIGSHFLRQWLKNHPGAHVVMLDSLSYAGNLMNLRDLSPTSFTFAHGSINDAAFLRQLFQTHKFSTVINFAAESHVDRSIDNPTPFVETNVLGTSILLDACRHSWKDNRDALFVQMSTDEVFGELGEDGFFTEETPYGPRSPYSAAKAGGDHMVHAYNNTYKLPAIVVHCSNNYGPYQFPEKLIPLTISRCVEKKQIPVYGQGTNVRDWIHVADACRAIAMITKSGRIGERYLIGGENPIRNIDVVNTVCDTVTSLLKDGHDRRQLITYVKDRAGHDFRYATNTSKVRGEFKWTPEVSFKSGLKETVEWYLSNTAWLNAIHDGSYRSYRLPVAAQHSG